MVERVKEKAHIHSLTADGDEQQKCSRYPGNKAAATFQTYLNDLNSHSDFVFATVFLHSTKYLNIQTFCTF